MPREAATGLGRCLAKKLVTGIAWGRYEETDTLQLEHRITSIGYLAGRSYGRILASCSILFLNYQRPLEHPGNHEKFWSRSTN